MNHSEIEADAFKDLFEQDSVLVLDVRTTEEFSDGHLKGAINISIHDEAFEEKINELERGKKCLVYCSAGGRSRQAMYLMGELGFDEVYNLAGGIDSWIENGYNIEKEFSSLTMEIKQFFDENLAQASYAVRSNGEIILIDPFRDPQPFYDYAKETKAKITGVIETHSHADFISSHLEISKTLNVPVYINEKAKPEYEFQNVADGDELKVGKIKLKILYTPGHSPDSVSILVFDVSGNEYALISGDTLLIGDVGRPDLREAAGPINKAKEELARMMFQTVNEKLKKLSDEVLVYPAHGGGSLCGKGSTTGRSSTIKKEKENNYAFITNDEDKFVDELLSDQPFIPHYFSYAVTLNRKGAPDLKESLNKIPQFNSYYDINDEHIIIDARTKQEFDEAHFPGAVNMKPEKRFETWLGSFVYPDEKFYLIASTKEELSKLEKRCAKIGYELNIAGSLVHQTHSRLERSPDFDKEEFDTEREKFNILDVRDDTEFKKENYFKNAVHIPYEELRKRTDEIPTDKPLVVHCEGGSRSSVASSFLNNKISVNVFDLGNEIEHYKSN